MRSRMAKASALALAVAGAMAQTPGDTKPSTNVNLAVTYDTTSVTPNILISEDLVDDYTPAISYTASTLTSLYQILLVDLSIPQSSLNITGAPLPQYFPGLEYCRTTRLHWYQGNLTHDSKTGTFTNSSGAIATYGGPMPGLNDIPHTYTFYLFEQPENFSFNEAMWNAGRIYNPISVDGRMNFSVTAISDLVGEPVAATYIRVQNPENNATGTASNGTCPLDSVTGNGINGTATTSATPTATAVYTGLSPKIQSGMGAALVGVAAFAFATL